MSQRRPRKSLLRSPRSWQFTRLLVGVVASSAIGAILLVHIFAAGSSLAFETESGTLTGDVTTVTDSAASGGSAVQLGGSAPTNLQAFTGGNNIALVWDMPSQPVQSVQVFRNNSQIATVTPNSSSPIQNAAIGKEYDDNAVSAGSTYQYKIRAVLASGATTPFTPSVAATQPTSSQPVPTISVNTTGDPGMAATMTNSIVPLLKTWYPKVADFIAYPNYTAPTSYTINFSNTDPADVCATSGGSSPLISCNPSWFTGSNISGTTSGLGALFVHESTHVIQNNASGPSWTIEGGASFASDFFARQNINLFQPYPGDSIGPYTPGAWFIEYMRENVNANFPRDLEVAIHNGSSADAVVSNDSGGKYANAAQAWQGAVNAYSSATGGISGIGSKCAEVQNGTVADGTKIVLNSCNSQSQTEQLNVTFNSGISGKCLDDWLGSSTSNADLYTCTSSNSQWWTVQTNGTIKAFSGGCLDDSPNANGNQVTLAACNASDSRQQWTVSGNTIKNPATGKCLDDPGSSTTDSTALDMFTCNGTNAQKWTPTGGTTLSGDFAQQWSLMRHNQSQSGPFEITSATFNAISQAHWCMDVSFSGTADGTAVQYWGCDQTPAQYWTFGTNGSLVNVNSGKCLDTIGGNSTTGTQLEINTCNGSASQTWTTPAGTSATSCSAMPSGSSSDALNVPVPTAGTYNVWARIKTNSSSASGLYFQSDQAGCANTIGGAYLPAGTWTWVNYHDGNPDTRLASSLSAGSHIFTLGSLSSGLQVDKVILTTDTACTPTGDGSNCTASQVVGDLNNDGKVNIFDLSTILSDWNTANSAADLNHDGTVNIFDLSILISHWTG